MMPFCLCGDLECICEGRCGCDRRFCLCTSCHDLRRKEWCKVCALPFSYGELSASTSAVDVCKCSSLTNPIILLQRFRSSYVSSGVLTENVHVSEPLNAEKDSETQNLLQALSNLTSGPKEQEMLKDIDTTQNLPEEKVETEESSELLIEDNSPIHCFSRLTDDSPKNSFPSPELINIKESSSTSSLQYSSGLEMELFKRRSFTEQIKLHTDNDASSSKERDRPAESCSFSPRSCGSRHSNGNSSISESLDSDFSMLEIPDNRCNSEFSIIEMPEYERNSSSRINSYMIGDPTAVSIFGISSLPSEQRDNLHHRFASVPPIHLYIGSLINRSILTVPRTIMISPIGELPLVPSPNSQLSPLRNSTLNQEESSSSMPLSVVSPIQATSALSRDALTSQINLQSPVVSRIPDKDKMSSSKLGNALVSQNIPLSMETTRQLTQEVSEFPSVPRAESPERLYEVSSDQDI